MRRRILPFVIVTALAAGIAGAQGTSEPDRAELALAKQQAAEALRRSQALDAQAARATSEAARARAEAEALTARIQASEAEITAAETRLRLIEGLAREQRARLAERQGPVVRLSAALQTMARRPPALALVQPGSIDDVVHVRSLLASTLPVIRRRTAGLRREVDAGNRLREQARAARTALVTSREELHRRRVALARFEAEQRRRSAGLAESAVLESDRALVLGEEARDIESTIGTREFQRRLAAELARLPEPVERPGSTGGGGRRGQGRYLLPVQGRLVTGIGEISDAGVHARGLVFATEPEAPVVAPVAGRIVYAGRFRSYDQVLIIDHGGGWTSVITDLDSVAVRVGQTVARGQRLGRAATQAPRVGVELRRGGRPVAITQLLAG